MSCQPRRPLTVRRRLLSRRCVLTLWFLAGQSTRLSAKRRWDDISSPLSSDNEAPAPVTATATRPRRSGRGRGRGGGSIQARGYVNKRRNPAMSALPSTPLQESPQETSRMDPSTLLQKTSCIEALPHGPFPTTKEPNLSWCHACWHEFAGSADIDTECTFKGTRFLQSEKHRVRSIKTSYRHTGPAAELEFRKDWKPSEPAHNHKKVLKVSAL
jgi:hypothetical protein